MQAVLLAAGQSSRFYPLSGQGHKSMVKVAGKTLLEHTLFQLRQAKISEAIIVVSDKKRVSELLSGDKNSGLKITLVEQPAALGMGEALLRVEKHITGSFFLMHAHHVDFSDFSQIMLKKMKSAEDLVLLVKKEKYVEKYGTVRIDGDRVVEIVEKPVKGEEPSDLRVIGIYLLPKLFFQTLRDTSSDHYSLENAISTYAKHQAVRFTITNQSSATLKYPWDLLSVSEYILSTLTKKISPGVVIAKSAHIEGEVTIGENVTILEHATIKGPAYIGKNAVIGTNAIIRNGVSIGEGVFIGANMEVRGSIIMDGTSTHSGFIGDSIIGRDCKIGAQFLTTNVRLDRSQIRVMTQQGDVESGRKNLGCIVGRNVKIGGKTTSMPGVLIGDNVIIGPATTVTHNIAEDITYYTKFQEVVIKHKTGQR